MKTSFAQRLEAALGAPRVTDEQVAVVLQLLLAQRERVGKRCGRYFLLFIGFAAAFTVLVNHGVKSLVLFGITFSGEQPVSILIAILAAYALYESAWAAAYGQVVSTTLGAYWRLRMSAFERHDITALFEHPSALFVDSAVVDELNLPFRWFSRSWMIAMMAALVIGPLAWFVAATRWIAVNDIFSGVVKVFALGLIWLFVVRAAVLMIHVATIHQRDTGEMISRLLADGVDPTSVHDRRRVR